MLKGLETRLTSVSVCLETKRLSPSRGQKFGLDFDLEATVSAPGPDVWSRSRSESFVSFRPAVTVREQQAEELELRTKYNISDQEFEVIRSNVVRSIPHKAGVQWKFDGALFFVTTVITTIGQKYFYFYSIVAESEVNV